MNGAEGDEIGGAPAIIDPGLKVVDPTDPPGRTYLLGLQVNWSRVGHDQLTGHSQPLGRFLTPLAPALHTWGLQEEEAVISAAKPGAVEEGVTLLTLWCRSHWEPEQIEQSIQQALTSLLKGDYPGRFTSAEISDFSWIELD